jgi:class 3 adenylate cyclase
VTESPPTTHSAGEEGALDTAILFVDLVDSSIFASVLDLKSYSDYMRSFHEICCEQCNYFFGTFLKGQYRPTVDYEAVCTGDELIVYLHTGNSANDVYLLTILAIAIKCAWLGAPFNRGRLERRTVSSEAAAGINFGKVWTRHESGRLIKYGYAINLTKRIETLSRTGERYRIFLSDSAFKQINTKMRNLLFSQRQLMSLKGIVGNVGIYELHDSFVNPLRRLDPRYQESFRNILRVALENNSRDLWIHSSLQVIEEAEKECITDETFALCRQVVNIDPQNPVALYHLAQGYRERADRETAKLILGDLVSSWPSLGDGWLEYGKLLADDGDQEGAREAFLRARMCGIDEAEDFLSG